jgi:hypothetical protein
MAKHDICRKHCSIVAELKEQLRVSIQINSEKRNCKRPIDFCNDLIDENRKIKGMLKVAKCPNCDGSGAVPVQVGPDDWEAEQCQWCDEYKQIFGKYPNE